MEKNNTNCTPVHKRHKWRFVQKQKEEKDNHLVTLLLKF